MFFARPGVFAPCGIFSIKHFVLLAITFICIIIALKFTKNMEKSKIKKLIAIITIFLWILEIIKIGFNLSIGNASNPNTYIPLYFCSLILYAGLFSGFGKGKIKKIGDVFLSTGGIVAGVIFLVYPLTSLTTYPVFHFISIQSFVLHGLMVYIGLLILITNYVTLELKDIKYYAGLIIAISLIAYVFNLIFDSNLMFISKNYPGTYIETIYNITGVFFPVVMTLAQAILPFYIIYGIKKLVAKCRKENITYEKN